MSVGSALRLVIGDWVTLIASYIIAKGFDYYKKPELNFDLNDLSIRNPHVEDIINPSKLVMFFCIITCLVIIGIQMFKGRLLTFDTHQVFMGVLFSYFFSSVIASLMKNFIGKARPDFIDVCKPDPMKVAQQLQMYNDTNSPDYILRTIFNTSVCTGVEKDINTGTESFPSSHSSSSFSIMGYLSLYIAGQVHLLNRKCNLWKFLIVSIPSLFALFVAISRVHDHRHHPTDVIAGSLLGIISAALTYFYFFPSLKDPNCDIPYQDRKDKTSNQMNQMNQVNHMNNMNQMNQMNQMGIHLK